jgi:murein DD-endopeptidase MepM/ murein hydrolase activator NlpD
MNFKFQISKFKLLSTHYGFLVVVAIVVSITNLNAQTDFPKNYFTSPMFLPINLAGNFGEIRSNHFHSGIDIKTNEQEGQVVMAVADGYISRIKISAVGFGKAIYINHPNGFTTVYGHLQRFNDSIQSYVESEQYKKESFDIDISLDSTLFPVKQGQFIALSGNTGGSEGPHLHFEIRNTISEHPINSLLFGYHLEDTIAPTIRNLKIYQLHQTKWGLITDSVFNISIKNSSESTELKNDTVYVLEKTAFSIEAFDKMNDTSSNLVVNKIDLLLDNKIIYSYHFDEFSFDELRYVNANIDYAEKINNNKKYILLYRLQGNNFSMFGKDFTMTGLINITDTLFHSIEIKASDINGNITEERIKIKLKGKARKKIVKEPFISFNKTLSLTKPGIKFSVDKNVIYNISTLELKQEKKIKGTYSPLFTVGDETIPIHTFISLALKPINLPSKLFEKALIASVSKKGYLSAEGGGFIKGWVTGKIKHFGKFTIAIDTIAPEIKQPEIYTDSISGKRILFTTIFDNLSGIKEYRATLNGKWLLMEYDEKTGKLSSELKDSMMNSQSELIIEVVDKKENKRTLETIIN